jgi:hypothetical protein
MMENRKTRKIIGVIINTRWVRFHYACIAIGANF